MNTAAARVRALPLWRTPVEPRPLVGGLSNQCFTVVDAGETFVVRLGHDLPCHHVVREREVMVARAAHAAGFAPELVHSEPGVMVTRFVDGITCDAAHLRGCIPRVATLLAGFHQSMPERVSGPASLFWPFHVIRDYARTLDAGGSPWCGEVPGLLKLSAELEAAQQPLPIVFGHHDLLPANLIDDGQRLWLIDFEYAGFSTAMFDLAGLGANAGFSAEQATELLECYFGARPGPEILRAHAAMMCTALLREAMWSMVSELHLDRPGVDYAAYTRDNLATLSLAVSQLDRDYPGIVNSG